MLRAMAPPNTPRTSLSRRATAIRATVRPDCACPIRRSRSSKSTTPATSRANTRVDEIGLVVVKGPSVTPGYVDDAANKGILLPDGWFNSGDLGRIDADGYLWITGRAKDIIIRGGHNIDPTVIEETLLKHPRRGARGGCQQAGRLCRRTAGRLCATGAGRQGDGGRGAGVRALPTARSARRRRRRSSCIDKMPLTDVGKPAKVQLRLDAARRAFTAALADVAGGGGIRRHGG